MEYLGLKYFLGGLLQGTGYFLAVGCPLGMLVRIGEGSKFHVLVFVGFLIGVALYVGVLDGLVSSFSILSNIVMQSLCLIYSNECRNISATFQI